jgi:hypothetical protein
MPSTDEQLLAAHREWIGYVQPVGLVVAPAALLSAQAVLDRNVTDAQARLRALLRPLPVDCDESLIGVPSLREMLHGVLDWQPADIVDPPDDLCVVLPEFGETLRPSFGAPAPADDGVPWTLLALEVPPGTDLDADTPGDGRHWTASPQARFERLLRETGVPVGLLSNGAELRLVYAPRGESSGHCTFSLARLGEVSGRPMLSAMKLLLHAERVFVLSQKERLPGLLAESRKYQNLVSTQLADQVLAALWELVRGFQAADAHRGGALFAEVRREDPNHIYAGLLTVLMRLVFVLYAEDRGLLPRGEVWTRYYSVAGLFERLRADAGRFPDTMDRRYGAWAQLLTLFRLLHDGGGHGALHVPARRGHLLDPDRYPFLEGRPWRTARQVGARLDPPLVSDGVVYRVLDRLIVLDGERLSYRTLDVQQIGSVYEAVMGFDLIEVEGPTVAVRSSKGAPVPVNLEALFERAPDKRASWLRERTDQTIDGKTLADLKAANTADDAVAALGKRVVKAVTPTVMAPGSFALRPTDERRRSGSHYTPRSLTEPIVRKALEPVLRALGERPTPQAILDLKVCDPAMGSGAFLVEACRQLGDALSAAWHAHQCVPDIPPDEDELLHACRVVAQRCLYGVDRNAMAVDLAKLSLWLATLARDHDFTFLDHALRHGDSLIGLTAEQIVAFDWGGGKPMAYLRTLLDDRLTAARKARGEILAAGDEAQDEPQLRLMLREAEEALDDLRLVGDLVVAAFFAEEKDNKRKERRAEFADQYVRNRADPFSLREIVAGLREGTRPVIPFHWQIEFPEVFGRELPGFDAIVGNPPFAGKNTLAQAFHHHYGGYLVATNTAANGKSDLVAFFFRRAYDLLRTGGCLGLLGTNTVAQGHTRTSGLAHICRSGGQIFAARRRVPWPGTASVIVSVVHIAKGRPVTGPSLDGHRVDRVNAFLLRGHVDDDPPLLASNRGRSFQGSNINGPGFLFEDDNPEASPLSEMQAILRSSPHSAERIRPYIGGEELTSNPQIEARRYVIGFGRLPEEECRSKWPELMSVVEQLVRPFRERGPRTPQADYARRHWWQWHTERPTMYAAIRTLDRVLVTPRVSNSYAFVFLPAGMTMNEKVVVFAYSTYAAFAGLQSRVHEIWARLLSSTLGDTLQYTPSKCFETFPLPSLFEKDPTLEDVGHTYYEFRALLMVENNEGLTKTYNRFHDPDESDAAILRLRELHAAMDRAVMHAYGWSDLDLRCEFLLDYDDEDDAGGRRKRPWRYRWPDDLRDEVLARLLDLNQKRVQAEAMAGGAARGRAAGAGKPRARPKRHPDLFGG